MGMDAYGAKLTRRDVGDLAAASEQLVVVADTIRRARPAWGEATVNLLIVVNNTIVRIQNKGAAAFARYLEKHPAQAVQDVREGQNPGDDPYQVVSKRTDEPEDE